MPSCAQPLIFSDTKSSQPSKLEVKEPSNQVGVATTKRAAPSSALQPSLNTVDDNISPPVGCEASGAAFFFSGNFSGTRPALMQRITGAGGDISNCVKKATHILISATAAAKASPSAALSKLLQKESDKPVVCPAFLDALVDNRRLELRTAIGLDKSDLLRFGSGPGISLVYKPSVVPAESKETIIEPTTKKRKISSSNSRLELDGECGFGGKVLLTEDGTDAYSVTLNQYSNEFNKFYKMQLIQSGNQLIFFKKWGRVGESAIDVHTSRFGGKAEAIKAFEKKFKESTGNQWSNRDQFVKKPNRYYLVKQADDPHHDEFEPAPEHLLGAFDSASSAEKSGLAPATTYLMRQIFDAKMLAASFQRMQIDAMKLKSL